ncbi:TonB-dependent siderophore receptor [Xylophilus sp.]|uniref:TonB-dependent siderophore receptor n=1 Tax=Xylophilus sp. TaxID=2653893 RepID=UPI0013B7B4BF|nr:TonB-dependent siderophore receptor [Xylophilus sp.]KAF1050312.1 MAG: Ferrichrome outer membrane transporter/phage receptor [Xylophilus sp.]
MPPRNTLGRRPVASAALIAGGLSSFFAAPAFAQSTLPEVRVTAGQDETATSAAGGFIARRATAGTKTDTPLIETPQSVSVVTREQVEAQAADSLDQAFGYTAGIFSLGGGAQRHTATGFTVRGFNVTGSAPLYLNGSRFPINSLSGTMEPYAFERMELLKGPASILYGQAAPGGIINLVSKRPTAEPLREVEVQAGSWRRKQIAVDLAGPLAEDGRFAYRLTALKRDSNTMIRAIPDDRTLLDGALDWRIAPGTTLTLLGTYSKGHSVYDYGKPAEGTLLPNVNGRIARTLFVGEPGFDFFDTEGKTLGYLFEHRLNDDWTFRQNLLGFDYTAGNAWSAVGSVVQPEQRLLTRTAMTRADTDRGLSLDNQLLGRLRHGDVQHTVLLGLDWGRHDFSRAQAVGTAPSLDLFAPVYGGTVTVQPQAYATQNNRQTGLYLQDQIKFGPHWIALVGGRYDESRDTSRTTLRATGAVSATNQTAHAFTPRAGVLYLADNGLAPYYSFSKSFQPTSGTDYNLNPFVPTRGVQHEVGVKVEPAGGRTSVTVAAYELTQQNVTTTDPAHAGYSVQTGEVRSRGFEVEGKARIAARWEIVAAASTTDARVTRSNSGTAGTRPTNVPRHQASLWADYRVSGLPGLSVGAGVRNVGPMQVTAALATPSYTVVDAAVRYQFDHWRFALNIKNVADRTYLSSCSYACFYGDERNVLLTARYSW